MHPSRTENENLNESENEFRSIEKVQRLYADVMRQFFARLNVTEDSNHILGNDRVISIGDVSVGFRLDAYQRLIDIYISLDHPSTMPQAEIYRHLLTRQSCMKSPYRQIYGVNPDSGQLVMRTFVSLDEVSTRPEEFVVHVKLLVAGTATIWA